MPEEHHPDPGWWVRCGRSTTHAWNDLCAGCGHVRSLHVGTRCTSEATSLIGAPDPCECTHGHPDRFLIPSYAAMPTRKDAR